MTIAHLIVCGAFAALAGFILGWLRGRRDLARDTESELRGLIETVDAIPTHCTCGAELEPRCAGGCAVTVKVKGGRLLARESQRIRGNYPKGGG